MLMWKAQKEKRRLRVFLHTALSLAVALVLLAGNFLFTAYGASSNLFVDMTAEGRYTLRQTAVNILLAADVHDNVDIIFCADDDVLRASYNSSLIYTMALEMEKQVPYIHVSTVNVRRSPELVAAYKRTSATTIAWDDVIVTSGTEYRVYKATSFFTVSSNNSDTILGFNGEQKMTEAILALTAKDLPIACFVTGHGETVPSQSNPETADLFERIRYAGFTIKTIDLETEDLPETCTLVILNGPTTDYPSGRLEDADYTSPITKLDRFLDRYGTLFYFRDPAAGTLPNLEEFLAEWGIGFRVTDPSGKAFADTTLIDSSAALSGDARRICGIYGTSSIYADITALSSPPKTVFESCAPVSVLWQGGISSSNSAGRKVETLFSTTSAAQAVDREGNTVTSGTFPLMTMTTESRMINNVYYTAYVFVCGTTLYHAADYFSENVYGNGEVFQSALRGAARTTASVADALEFKYYESADFTTTDDATQNTIYRRDGEGNVIWITDPETGTSYKSVLRVIRPITDGEKTMWTWVLAVLPALLLFGTCGVVVLRRRGR